MSVVTLVVTLGNVGVWCSLEGQEVLCECVSVVTLVVTLGNVGVWCSLEGQEVLCEHGDFSGHFR